MEWRYQTYTQFTDGTVQHVLIACDMDVNKFPAMDAWCDTVLGYKPPSHATRNGTRHFAEIAFAFDSQEDAMAFKLTWGS